MLPRALLGTLYNQIARPILFSLEPERAHDLTLRFLRLTQQSPIRHLYTHERISDPIKLLGLSFPNKVGLAAGLDKDAACIDALSSMGFGFIEVGTVTPIAQSGNPKPRMFRLQAANALINRLGFNNQGVDSFIKNVQRSRARNAVHRHPNQPPVVLGLNIGKNAMTPIERAIDDYLLTLRAVYPYADYVTINISSPNTKNLRDLQKDEALDALLSTLEQERQALFERHARRVPLFLKIAPDIDEAQAQVIASSLKKVQTIALSHSSSHDHHGAWGLIATNTTLARDLVQGLNHSLETGGLSGSPVLEPSNKVIRAMRKHLGKEFVIIGVGGVLTGEGALSKLAAGANLVQIYTGLIYRGPSLVVEVAQAIKASS